MTDESAAPKRGFSKSDFYRLCREWHGYLSALAFAALIFFSATGILLNHPGLLGGKAPAPVEKTFTLDAAQIAAVRLFQARNWRGSQTRRSSLLAPTVMASCRAMMCS